jgi:hypothetical protein
VLKEQNLTVVWCSTENAVSLFPLSKTYKSISVALINSLAWPENFAYIGRTFLSRRGAQAVGLGSHLNHLIYIYKLKITKYMCMAP